VNKWRVRSVHGALLLLGWPFLGIVSGAEKKKKATRFIGVGAGRNAAAAKED